MEENPKKSKTQVAAQLGDSPPAAHVHLPEELVTEILLRLPGESVIRARAVSKAWRRLATDPAFVADHARSRPLEILEHEQVRVSPWIPPYGFIYNVTVDATPVSTAADRPSDRRRLMRYDHPLKSNGTTCKSPHGMYGHCDLKASCDGLLLLKVGNGVYLICNPATRQWTELPRLPKSCSRVVFEYGFYHHQPSGEFRLLCRCFCETARARAHYVLSTGDTEHRLLSVADAEEAAVARIEPVLRYHPWYVPAALHGRLHWISPSPVNRTVVAFDTMSETFHRMTPPPASSMWVMLFAMAGQLAAAEFGDEQIDLWFLNDCNGADGQWERRHRLATPPMRSLPLSARPIQWFSIIRLAFVATDEADVILFGTTTGGVAAYNLKTKTWRVIIEAAGNVCRLSGYTFRETIEQHQCFEARPSYSPPLINFSCVLPGMIPPLL